MTGTLEMSHIARDGRRCAKLSGASPEKKLQPADFLTHCGRATALGCTSRFIKTTSMEPIKITDKLTLRQEALRMAILHAPNDLSMVYVLKDAERCESYLQGSADLPEHDNSMEKYLHEMKDILFKQHNPWISADSEMKPYEDALVVAHSPNGRTDVLRYHDGVFIDELNQEHCIDGWMSIPPFTQPAL